MPIPFPTYKFEYTYMKFNKAKSKLMHLGQSNPKYVRRLGEEPFEGSPVEKNFRVLMDEKLDMNEQHTPAAQKANCVLSCIKRGVALSREREQIVFLYSTLLRPHLMYYV